MFLGVVEAIVFAAALYLGALIRFQFDSHALFESVGSLFLRSIMVALVMISSQVAMGLYQARKQESLIVLLGRLITAFLLGGVVLSLIFYFFPDLHIGRGILFFSMLLAFALIFFVRVAFYRLITAGVIGTRVLVLGAGECARTIMNLMDQKGTRGYVIAGFLPVRGEDTCIDSKYVIGNEHGLCEIADSEGIDEILVAVTDRRKEFPLHELMECKMKGVGVISLEDFIEREVKKINLEGLLPSSFIFSDGYQRHAVREAIKRAFDLVVSSVILVIAWPILLAVPVAIKIDEGWRAPIFFRQTRVGEDDRRFRLLKFRSMREGAEEGGMAQWAEQDDSRVTRVGAYLRKYRVDELPQILNVLRGEMSFVGPRPERPEFVEDLAIRIPYYRERHRVRPGITGWAQLCYHYGASEDDAREKLQYDLYYVKNHSLMLDVLILLQTIEVVVSGKGAR